MSAQRDLTAAAFMDLHSRSLDPSDSELEPDRAVAVIPISSLVCSSWVRVGGENRDHVRSLADTAESLPPVVVHRPTMRVIDGRHRIRATTLRGGEHIQAIFFNGNEDDAFILAVRLNAAHGLPLSRADRAAAAARIIRSNPQWSDRAIASTTGLSDKTVATVRRRSCADIPHMNDRIGRDGRARPIDSSAGRITASRLLAEQPDATLREIATQAGISLGTARDVRQRVRRGRDPVPDRLREASAGPEASLRRIAVSPSEETDRGLLPEGGSAQLLENLRRDPSLCYSEFGRVVLRLLAVHTIPAEHWNRLVESVPTHRASTVAQLARSCAAAWQQFAGELDEASERPRASGL